MVPHNCCHVADDQRFANGMTQCCQFCFRTAVCRPEMSRSTSFSAVMTLCMVLIAWQVVRVA